MHKRLIILDRDGVINRDSPHHITTVAAWQALPGSLEAIAQLCRANYLVAVITNQSGIGRALYSINTLNQIHQKMLDELKPAGGDISAIFFCPHTAQAGCRCRKPKPGLFLELGRRLQRDLRDVYAVGDSLRDLQAASAAGAQPVLVQTGNGADTARFLAGQAPAALKAQLRDVPAHRDLAAFVDELLGRENPPAR